MGRLTLLGVELDPLTAEELNHQIAQAVEQRERHVFANHNLHSVYLYHRDEEMRRLYAKAHGVFVDGMSLLLWGRLLGYPLSDMQRTTYVDWVHPLMSTAAERGWRVFYLGGKPGVAERAAAILCKRYPELQLRTRHGYFSDPENRSILEEVRAYRPHILMVGMGMPRQEHWVLENLEHLQANVILTVGACFDYVAGVIPTPPRWMGRLGLEWLFRLLSEPRRLWRRYLVEPWFLLKPAAKDVLGILRHARGNDKA